MNCIQFRYDSDTGMAGGLQKLAELTLKVPVG
jgi:hypothetical protein